MTTVAMVDRSSMLVTELRPGVDAAAIAARSWDGAMQAYWLQHHLIDLDDAHTVEIGDLCTDVAAKTFSKSAARLAKEADDQQEQSERAALTTLVAQIQAIADGSQALNTDAQRVTAIRLCARACLFAVRFIVRRQL